MEQNYLLLVHVLLYNHNIMNIFGDEQDLGSSFMKVATSYELLRGARGDICSVANVHTAPNLCLALLTLLKIGDKGLIICRTLSHKITAPDLQQKNSHGVGNVIFQNIISYLFVTWCITMGYQTHLYSVQLYHNYYVKYGPVGHLLTTTRMKDPYGLI